MKLEKKDLAHGKIRVQIENLDDLWYLSQMIDTNDLATSKTLRKVAHSGEGERKQVSRKPAVLTLRVTKVEWAKTSPTLRILGVIEDGPEDIPRGEHHSFSVEGGTSLTITKDKWLSYQLDKLKEATEGSTTHVLVAVFDREDALFALLKKYGYDVLSSLKGNVAKKEEGHTSTGDFYQDILNAITKYDERYGLTSIIVASPAFFKEDLMKRVSDEKLRKKILLASTNSVGKNGVTEVLKRPEVKQALAHDRAAEELSLVELLLETISKEGNVAYGLKEVQQASDAHAITHLLVTDTFISQLREKDAYSQLEQLFKATDQSQGKITIISSDHDGGQRLDGLGGIGALLRFRIG